MSDEDIRKYLPKPADILRRFDEDAAKRKLEEALDNPELDQALADLENQPKSPTHAGDPSRGEGPWHEAPPGVAVSPTLPPAGAARKPRTARARPRIPAVVSVLLAALAVTAPAILVAILKAPAPLDSSLRHPATAELAATNSAVPRETPGVVDAGQSGTAPAPDAGPERQTPEPAGSSSAALPATASASASPRAPPSPAAPQKRPGTSKRAPAPSIPEDILQ